MSDVQQWLTKLTDDELTAWTQFAQAQRSDGAVQMLAEEAKRREEANRG